MKISKEKKKQILADKDHLSIHEISKKYNLPKYLIKKILDTSEKKPASKWFFAVLILIPVLFFVILELSLRIFSYGYDTSQWVDAGSGKYIINPDLSKRYFNNVGFVPSTTEDVFDKQKKKNSYRIFILGGSSAAGYPYMPMGSFSRYIRKRLELVYPNTITEVINISMTAVNSYTILDLVPGVLEQKPDLILIYAGHNEFYGALGVGSTESIGSSRNFVNLVLYLNKYKVTQLVRNSINWILSFFTSDKKEDISGTLMSSMAKDQYIPMNSVKFNAGLEQFDGNLRDILNLVKNENVPVILGRLASNLKDQKPFISTDTPNYKTADQIYEEARLELNNKNIPKADSLFRLAKDLDALRFRAPEKINTIINNLSKEFNVETISIDSLLTSASPDGIVGNNFMVDHLHPNLKGYQLMGKAFYEVMEKSGNIPQTENPNIPYDKQDSLTCANFIFTDLDSVIGNNIITLLKNDWPFIEKMQSQSTKNLFKPKNSIDSIAMEYIENKISWADAHINAAIAYLRKDDISNHLKHMNLLIYQYPFLIDYTTALKYFYEKSKIDPGDFTPKRVGIISLYNKKYDDAVKYLSKSYQSNSKDTLVLYNLAVAYSRTGDFESALNTIIECLSINPDYPDANNLKQQLINTINSQSKY